LRYFISAVTIIAHPPLSQAQYV